VCVCVCVCVRACVRACVCVCVCVSVLVDKNARTFSVLMSSGGISDGVFCAISCLLTPS